MRRWWQDLTDLVLPAECEGCGAPRTLLCPRCRAALGGAGPRRIRPVPEPPGLPVVHAAAPYADAVRALLLAHKERGALALAGALGTALAGAVRAGLAAQSPRGAHGGAAGAAGGTDGHGGVPVRPPGPAGGAAGARGTGAVLLVPVPSARWAVRARGHDPVRRMALAAAGELRRTGTPARVAAVLRQRRAVADQARLDARGRLENLAGALGVVEGGTRLLASGRVVLVDDLITTGASLAEAARALRESAGCREPGGDGETTAVYEAATREGRGKRRTGSGAERGNRMRGAPEKAMPNALGGTLLAAVVAAPRDSFEISRNRP
ncbi:ComF family protein [Streptomyces sp. TG1A-8]|uniref:ComF family protein n=1 Tax=Streptomyces sp. TG1A-8 TaxID=3051385 RepID=UPI00265BBEAD|nr:ComF family protein [Streptomyces sp. TG1A-8]MDO0927435.1 ComF family protein [Streptomyces sp. TG1A-8]